MRWDFKQLSYFVAVAEELHFGRAAKRVGISQPPLTQQIQSLEQKVGARLLERTKRHVALTAAGRLLLREAKDVLSRVTHIDRAIQQFHSGEAGSLTIGCAPTALFKILPVVARDFRSRYPNAELLIKESHSSFTLDALLEKQMDVGFVWGDVSQRPIESKLLISGTFRAAVSSLVGDQLDGRITLEQLAAIPLFITPRAISPFHYDNMLAAFAKAGLTPRIAHETPTMQAQVGHVAAGCGAALLPPFAEEFVVGLQEYVRILEIEDGNIPFAISAAWNKDNVSPLLLNFLELLSAQPVS